MSRYFKREKRGLNNPKHIKHWTHSDEANILIFLKQNPDFENPTARVYYKKFLQETGMDIYWKLVAYKVRNMRTVYRRAKEYQKHKKDSNDMDNEEIRKISLKICWYVDEFDVLFPEDLDNDTRPDLKTSWSDDESSNEDSVSANDEYNNSSNHFAEECVNEQPSASYIPSSIERDILAVQTGQYNYKRQKFDDDITTKYQELELAKERLIFEKEKFRQEIRLKEKEINSRERLKTMELQMKERIAMRELELKEKLASQSMGKQESSIEWKRRFVYHNIE